MLLKPKAIFLDMDGTILNRSNKVSIQTKEIIDESRKTGNFCFYRYGKSV